MAEMKHEEKFLEDGVTCPFCGSDDTDGTLLAGWKTPHQAEERWDCDTCGAKWRTFYRAVAVKAGWADDADKA